MENVLFTQDQVIQLVNSIFSKKSWDSLAEAFSVASAAAALSGNRFHVPVVVTAQGPATVSHSQPTLQVHMMDRVLSTALSVVFNHLTVTSPCLSLSLSDSQLLVTDVMSQPLDSANVVVESAYAVASKAAILNQAPFTINEYV